MMTSVQNINENSDITLCRVNDKPDEFYFLFLKKLKKKSQMKS